MEDKTWSAWVWVKMKPGAPAECWQTWKKNPKIKCGWSTMGDSWDCVLSLKTDSPGDVDNFVCKEVKCNEWVENCETTFTKQCW